MTCSGLGYAHILKDMLPLFRKAGITEGEIEAMLMENPVSVLQLV